MVETISTREAWANFGDVLGSVYYTKESVIVERKGKAVAVIISPEEFERFRRQAAAQGWAAIDRVRERNAEHDPDAILREATEEVEAVRRERHTLPRRFARRSLEGPMPFDRQQRAAILRERAADYARVARANIAREYPHMPYFVATGPRDYRTHRELHPAFYGCYDWHSSVEMHWVIVRLLRRCPDIIPGAEARAGLDATLTAEHLAAEVAFFGNPNHRSLERPYGWGWLLTLQHELATWDDPDGRRWAGAVAPLAELLAARLVEWLPKLTYPQRTGVHQNTAFGLSRSLDYATLRAGGGDGALLAAIHEAATRWFADDAGYPAGYEPSGADFLSPALSEAELLSRLLEPGELPDWLEQFLPGLAGGRPEALFRPATVSDPTDGQIAHLHGLNLSRAWAFAALAGRLPSGDERVAPLLAAAERHADASLPQVAGSDYMVEHWLAAYATLLLTEGDAAGGDARDGGPTG